VLIISQNLAPTYEQLADAYAHAKDKVYISKIDADGVGKEKARSFGVTGYPSKLSSKIYILSANHDLQH